MMHALRVIKHSARLPRVLLGGMVAVGLGLALWLALIPVMPIGPSALAAPNDTIEGLAAENDSPKIVGDSINFTASVTNGTGISYTWNFGDGNNGTGITTTHAYTAAGTFTATVTASNTTDITSTTTSVVIYEPILGLSASNNSPKDINAPVSFTASVTSGTGISYTWDFGDGNNSTGITTTHPYTAAGIYTATVIAQNAAQSATATTTVTVTAPVVTPIAGLTVTHDGPKVVGAPVNFTAAVTSGTGISYTWDFGDGGSGTGITTTHSYTQTGLYTVIVVASNPTNTVTATTQVEIGNAIVDVRNNFYDPKIVKIPPGGKVIWVLREGPHSVTADNGSFEQPAGSDWGTFSHDFPTAAATNDTFIDYFCTVHGQSMSGTVIIDKPTILLPKIGKNLISD